MLKKLLVILLCMVCMSTITSAYASINSVIRIDKQNYEAAVGSLVKVDYTVINDNTITIRYDKSYLKPVSQIKKGLKRYVTFKVIKQGNTSIQLVNAKNAVEKMIINVKCLENPILQETAKIKRKTSKLSKKAKIKYIHDYICKQVSYDYDTYNGTEKANDESYYAVGAIKNGKAVCSGYAEYFELLANACGIEAEVIESKTHAWNIVKYNGKWYNIDVTWNDQESYTSYVWYMKNVPDFQRTKIKEKVGKSIYEWNCKKSDHTPINGWKNNMTKKSL